MVLAHLVRDNMEFHLDHEFVCFVPCLLVAWDKFHKEEPLDGLLFVVALLQTAHILDLEEAFPYLQESKHLEERCKA